LRHEHPLYAESDSQMQLMRMLRPLLRQRTGLVAAMVTLGFFASVAEGLGIGLFVPLLEGAVHATNELGVAGRILEPLSREQRTVAVSVCILTLVLLKTLIAFAYSALSNWVVAHTSNQMRVDLFNRLMTVDYAFVESKEQGQLVNVLATETWRVADAIKALTGMVALVCTVCVYVCLMLVLSVWLTVAICVGMLLISLVVRLLNRRVSAIASEMIRVNAALAGRMLEGLSALQLIRLMGREGYEQQRFGEISQRVARLGNRLGVFSGLAGPTSELLAAALLLGVLLITLQDPARVPSALVFIFVLYRLQPKMRALDQTRLQLVSLEPSVKAVLELINVDCAAPIAGKVGFDKLEHGIRFEHVSFRYAARDRPALNAVSLVIPAGKTTAVVGPSGAGKSTLVKLLLRLYEPTSGTVCIDDLPIQMLDLGALRTGICLVSQDVYVLNATVRENIAYGKLDADDDEIRQAARRADAHAFIEDLPLGYDTLLGDKGARLSGGQRQRLALARALVRDPKVLILDEGTNALDAISEATVLKTLDELQVDRTIVVIAHRLSTIAHADQIIVMQDGEVAETGTLAQLIKRDSLFTRMYELQASEHPAHASRL
jgi:ATP-binding cassette, subfamily B, bacterial MsbA